MKPKIVIVGAGGHGKVVLDVILSQDVYDVAGFVDDNIEIGKHVNKNFKIVSSLNPTDLKNVAEYFIVGIGNNEIREKLFNHLKENLKPATVIHPSAIIGSQVKFSPGSVILANVIVNTQSTIGENSIINAGVIIDHDCTIGNHVHLTIGTVVGSNSIVSDHAKTQLGEIILPFSKLERKF